MSRKAQKNQPPMTPKELDELKKLNVPLRVALIVVAVLIAGAAFANGVNEAIKINAGWQEVSATDAETNASLEFVLSYNLGAGEQSAKKDMNAVSALYTQALDRAYKALANEEFSGVSNLATLNSQPNTDIQVEPALYAALETMEEARSRWMCYAPLMEQYNAIFMCTYDEEAEQFDPDKDEATGEFARGIIQFIQDESAVSITLLGDNTVRLNVSQEYLDFAQKNEMTTFVDFGLLRNAFLCDAAADALAEQGYTEGVVSSINGFARNLCSEEFAQNLFDWVDGKAKNVGAVSYTAPAALVSLRAFPVAEEDESSYFVYSDGTVVTPYLAADGRPHTAASSLTTLAQGSVAELALRTLAAFTGDDGTFAALDDLSWVSTQAGQVQLHGDGFALLDTD